MAVPSTIQFRFKTPGISTLTAPSQSLFVSATGSGAQGVQFAIVLEYNGTGLTSGSYSGSVVDPYYEYGTLKFLHPENNISASVYLPFFDGGWWSVMATRQTPANNVYTIYAKNNIYNINTGVKIGFQASASCSGSYDWGKYGNAYIPGSGSITVMGSTYTRGSGSFQEIRYFDTVVNEQSFDDYVMNPHSIEANGVTDSYDSLFFRGALGGEMYTQATSIHPSVAGWTPTGSFFNFLDSGSYSTFGYTGSYSFVSNKEYFHFDQPAVGLKNRITNKIQSVESGFYGDVLSNQRSLEQYYPASQSYTRDVNYLEAGYSPQNEINDDIIQQLGYFNIGDYIGDPRQVSESTYRYPDLTKLNYDYFKKYDTPYNLQDYFRLVKFYDNSLFKLIKDFVPARTGAATGLIVKQHLLERNRQRPAQVSYTQPYYTGSILPQSRGYQSGSIEVFTGGAGGSVNTYNGSSNSIPYTVPVVQAWSQSLDTKAGLVSRVHSTQEEFYTGEYDGTQFEVIDSIPANNPLLFDTASNIYNIPDQTGAAYIDKYYDYLPTVGNVSGSVKSSLYRSVSYVGNAFSPDNLIPIQSGTAAYAEVQDSNYVLESGWEKGRYGGVKLTGAKYNVYTPGDVSYGKTAVIDHYSNYFAYFDWVGNANPEYPGGGNFHITKLIDINGNVVGLTAANDNLQLVENIFKQGTLATAYVNTLSANTSIPNLQVLDGGATLNTVAYRSGSVNVTSYTSYYTNAIGSSTFAYLDTLLTSSIGSSKVTDSGSLGASPGQSSYLGWLYPFVTSSHPVLGDLDQLSTSNAEFKIYNKRTGQYSTTNVPFAYQDSHLPLQYGDFIRVGYDAGDPTGSVDYSFLGQGLSRVSAVSASSYNEVNALTITPAFSDKAVNEILGVDKTLVQNFRIFRRVPIETFVLVRIQPPYPGNGLLIPQNFNPNFDAVKIARGLGLIE